MQKFCTALFDINIPIIKRNVYGKHKRLGVKIEVHKEHSQMITPARLTLLLDINDYFVIDRQGLTY